MTKLTATVTTRTVKRGLIYTVTLSNGVTATRNSTKAKRALAMHADKGDALAACSTQVSANPARLVAQQTGRWAVIDLDTGEVLRQPTD